MFTIAPCPFPSPCDWLPHQEYALFPPVIGFCYWCLPGGDDVGDLGGVLLERAHPIVHHKGDVSLLLAGHAAVEQQRYAADERLSDGAGPGLGHHAVARRHPLRHIAHEAVHHHLGGTQTS
eukprot:1073786-Prorocentrum_minimum.AAC.1